MQSFFGEAPLCLILGCVSKTNLKTRSSPAPSRLCPSQALGDFSFGAGDSWGSRGVLPCGWELGWTAQPQDTAGTPGPQAGGRDGDDGTTCIPHPVWDGENQLKF